MRPAIRSRPARARGFTVFEFAVCAGVTAILTAILLAKLLDYRAQMERASALQLVASARTAMAVRIAWLGAQGRTAELEALANENPMNWLARVPANYQGEYDRPRKGTIKPGHWYFDRSDKTINFLQSNDTFSSKTSKLLKFKVEFTRTLLPVGNNRRMEASLGLVPGR